MISTIYKISKEVYPNSPERLFVHHIGGDSLVIVSDFAEKDLSRPISIAVVIQRVLLVNGYIGKVGISIGDFADITGCWNRFYKLVENDLPKKECEGELSPIPYEKDKIDIGDGLMTLIPVLGTGLINSYNALNKGPSGPNIIIPNFLRDKIPLAYIKNNWIIKHGNYIVIKWIGLQTEFINNMCDLIDFNNLKIVSDIRSKFINYIINNLEYLSEKWLKNAKKLLL